MSLTAEDDPRVYYERITRRLTILGGSVLFLLGIVGNVLSCLVFSQRTMRRNPGTIYFIAYSIASFLTMTCAVLPIVLAALHIEPSLYSLAYCKIQFYLLAVFLLVSPYYLALAAIDRNLITSANASIRRRSTHRLAYYSIAGVTTVVCLYHSHLFVGVGIYEIYPGFSYCYLQPGAYRLFDAVSTLLINSIVLCILIVSGILTWRNRRRLHVRPVSVDLASVNAHRSKDRQLTLLILVDIVVYIILNGSFSWIFSIYRQLTQNQTKSLHQVALEQFLLGLFYILGFVNPSIHFYIYLTASRTFRRKTIKILFKLCRPRRINNRTTNTQGRHQPSVRH